MNTRVISGIFPVAVFFTLSRIAPAWLSVTGGFIAYAIVFYINRKNRFISGLTAFGFVIVATSAALGIFTDNEKAYLASGPIADFLFIPVHIISAMMRRPIIGGLARELFPAYAGRLPADHRVFMGLSFAFAAHDLCQGIFRVVLLRELSVGEYIVYSRVLFWPVTATLIGLTVFLIYRAARQADEEARNGPTPALAESA